MTPDTFDRTTIRASVPMYLLAKYINKNTNINVLFSGEGSDEASGSYLYFKNAPDDESRGNEIMRLMKDLHYFDVLRSDKTISALGLELRVPFLDKDFLKYYLGIRPILKRTNKYIIEKLLLRITYTFHSNLPDSILWRVKEAFSDGVSSQKRSWFSIIAESLGGGSEKEYYEKIYSSYFPKCLDAIPYYWMPKWSNADDPSARLLSVYSLV